MMASSPAGHAWEDGHPHLLCVSHADERRSQFFKFTNWAGISPEDREQRQLNEKRVPDLATYILDNEEDYLFSSITASYKSEPVFEPYEGNGDIGILKLKLGDELVITMASTAVLASLERWRMGEQLKDDALSVLLFPARAPSGGSRCSPTSTASFRKLRSRSISCTTSATTSPRDAVRDPAGSGVEGADEKERCL